jgi:hypothetical protein
MKKLFLLLLFICFSTVAQTYKFGACYMNSNFVKVEGKFIIGETKVSIETDEKNKKLVEYDAFKGTNGIIYITDGSLTHTLSFVEEKGKKKGFEHEIVIVLTLDKRKDEAQIKYYCKLVE